MASQMDQPAVLYRLRSLADPAAVDGMAKFGITPSRAFGVSIPALRQIAREIGIDHPLALELWAVDYRETRILASMVADPTLATESLLDDWAHAFDYWEICDQCCANLFEKTAFAYDKAVEWSSAHEEFVKRAGFVLMARLAVSDKRAPDRRFERLLPIIKREANDARIPVKKAVNWALRQIGKRSPALHRKALAVSREIQALDSQSARWIASDALRELTSAAVQTRLRCRGR